MDTSFAEKINLASHAISRQVIGNTVQVKMDYALASCAWSSGTNHIKS